MEISKCAAAIISGLIFTGAAALAVGSAAPAGAEVVTAAPQCCGGHGHGRRHSSHHHNRIILFNKNWNTSESRSDQDERQLQLQRDRDQHLRFGGGRD